MLSDSEVFILQPRRALDPCQGMVIDVHLLCLFLWPWWRLWAAWRCLSVVWIGWLVGMLWSEEQFALSWS